jgi:hypothetical protein
MLILGTRKLLTSEGQASDAEFFPPLRGVIFGSAQLSRLLPVLQSKADPADRQPTLVDSCEAVIEISGCDGGS